ncbi:dnaJ homolog subfamily C member 30, mitochondrial-like [Saccostrea echinata]|uniref:dnaJ homolog subfamily C member 30, mitochondrial-like n=1 Tax=Saccostrea echinata TaxID=191078 RepID=UPI002A8276FF|nr:dnaJ homolog subfamily C member 30, mitochondrial-like [Saccostrea echinata]XP_061197691.1 dnaJ homolog subfamily C member 30, mitochondrial-like [Saccostrea echinata]
MRTLGLHYYIPRFYRGTDWGLKGIHLRQYVTKHRHTRNTFYYEVLGVQSSASQTQIKKAYIDLTKIHHPDVSDSEESRKQFQLVSDAYTILGNVHSRRMYDRGLISGTHHSYGQKQSQAEEEEEFDPFKVPPKPVKTDLDKVTMKGYKEITDQRMTEARLKAFYKEKFEKQQKNIYQQSNKSAEHYRETTGVFLLLAVSAGLLYNFQKYMQSSGQQGNKKKTID